MSRSEREKLALTATRFKNWGATIDAELATVEQARLVIEGAAKNLSYAYLEAREEQEKLIDGGLSKEKIDSIYKLVMLPLSINPEGILDG